MGASEGDRAGSLLILTVRASYRKFKAQVEVEGRKAEQAPPKTAEPVPIPLPPCTSHWPAWLGHAPGVEQFGEALFREDFLFFGHLAHGLA